MGERLESARRQIEAENEHRLIEAERLVDSGLYNYTEARVAVGIDQPKSAVERRKDRQAAINTRGRLAVDAVLNKNNS